MRIDGSSLEACIRAAAASFDDGELAYLALTSMVERPLLDRIAYQLNQGVRSGGALVAREWKIPGVPARADIAVLENGAPTVILEGKAMYTEAPLRNGGSNRRFVDRMQSDLDRLADARLPGVDVYCLMLATHPHTAIPSQLQGIVKHAKRINAAFSRLDDHSRIAGNAADRMRALTEKTSLLQSSSIAAGQAFDITVEMLWWLFGPFRAPDRLQIRAG